MKTTMRAMMRKISTRGKAIADHLLAKRQRKLKNRWKLSKKISVSQWADKYRRLSAVSSAEPGRWSTARAPYQRCPSGERA